MTEYKVTGGGRVGLLTVNRPLVKLSVTANRLEISTPIGGKYVFAPDDVISIDYGKGLNPGIRITHKVSNYSSGIVFNSTDSQNVMNNIASVGFTPGKSIPVAEKMEIAQMQEAGAFSFKLIPIMVIVVIWNLCFIVGRAWDFSDNRIPTLPGQCATGFMFLVCLGIFANQSFAEMILKPGRTVHDVKTSVLFIMLVCGVMFLMATAFSFRTR